MPATSRVAVLHSSNIRRQIALVVVFVAALACFTVAAYVHASRPTAISPPVPSETQDHCPTTASPAPPSARLSAAAHSLMVAAAVKGTVRPLPGYTGVLQCADTLELFVFWKGAVPAPVTAAVSRLDLKVTVVENAPHTAVELRTTVRRVLADQSYWENQGVHIQGGDLRLDGRWCQIEVSNDQTTQIQKLMDARYPNDAIKVAHIAPSALL